jgi:hypothetical protein
MGLVVVYIYIYIFITCLFDCLMYLMVVVLGGCVW